MAIIGLMDVCAYAANCLGVAFCGAAMAALILAATQQVFTAAMSYFLLGRRLSPRQMSAVSEQGLNQCMIWLMVKHTWDLGTTEDAEPASVLAVMLYLRLDLTQQLSKHCKSTKSKHLYVMHQKTTGHQRCLCCYFTFCNKQQGLTQFGTTKCHSCWLHPSHTPLQSLTTSTPSRAGCNCVSRSFPTRAGS